MKTLTTQLLGSDARCFICGGESTAYWWRGDGVLAVCHPCAVEKLSLVIADANAGDHRANTLTAQSFEASGPRILTAYWRGAAIALSRRTRPGFDRDDSSLEDEHLPRDKGGGKSEPEANGSMF